MRIKIVVIVVIIITVVVGMSLAVLAAVPVPAMPYGAVLGAAAASGSLKEVTTLGATVERGVVKHKELLRSPITLQIDGNSNKFRYYIEVRKGKKEDSWLKRFFASIFTVLVGSEEYKSIREGDEITFYYKPGYWPFLKEKY